MINILIQNGNNFRIENIVSLQIKAHEVYIKPLKPRESILEIKESDDESDENDENDNEYDVLEGEEDLED